MIALGGEYVKCGEQGVVMPYTRLCSVCHRQGVLEHKVLELDQAIYDAQQCSSSPGLVKDLEDKFAQAESELANFYREHGVIGVTPDGEPCDCPRCNPEKEYPAWIALVAWGAAMVFLTLAMCGVLFLLGFTR